MIFLVTAFSVIFITKLFVASISPQSYTLNTTFSFHLVTVHHLPYRIALSSRPHVCIGQDDVIPLLIDNRTLISLQFVGASTLVTIYYFLLSFLLVFFSKHYQIFCKLVKKTFRILLQCQRHRATCSRNDKFCRYLSDNVTKIMCAVLFCTHSQLIQPARHKNRSICVIFQCARTLSRHFVTVCERVWNGFDRSEKKPT